MKTGDRLKKVRQYLGFSQKEFADILKISQQLLSKYENNKSEMSVSAAKELIQYKINIDWLLTGEGDITKKPLTSSTGEIDSFVERLNTLAKLDVIDWKIIDRLSSSNLSHEQKAQIEKIVQLTIEAMKDGGNLEINMPNLI